MRARAVVVAAGLALLAFGVPATASDDPRLTLSGSGFRYVDVALARKTVLDFFNFDLDHRSLTASYTGDFAGVAVQTGDASHRLLGGAVLVRGRQTRGDGGWASPVTLTDQDTLTLSPGKYRFVLISDGRAEVRIRATRGLSRSLKLAATKPFRGVAARRLQLDDPVHGAGATSLTRVPFTLAPRGLVVASFFSSPGDNAPTYLELCIRKPDDPQVPCDEGSIIFPGRSVTTQVFDRRRPNPITPAGSYVYDFTEVVVGADVRDGNAFVISFVDVE